MSKRVAEDSDSADVSKKVKCDDGDSESGVLLKDDEGNLYIDLGSMKRATVSVFRGKAHVNLREYYTDKSSGAQRPGKKGITLGSREWASLVANISPLTKQLELVTSGGSAKATAASSPAKTESHDVDKPAKKKAKTSDSEVEKDDE